LTSFAQRHDHVRLTRNRHGPHDRHGSRERRRALVAVATGALAGSGHGYTHTRGEDGPSIGEPAEAFAASRSVEVTMHESYYEPESVAVQPRADGIDYQAAKHMQATVGHGMHDLRTASCSSRARRARSPGRSPREGGLEFACNVPGHYEAGMQGRIDITE
jgi:uncharacterized cupredoxin-like copper-binding protein